MSVKTFDPAGWSLETALLMKGSRTVSVCIPCKNEAETIGDLVPFDPSQFVDALFAES